MRRSQTRPIQEIIGELLQEMNIERKLKEVHLVSQWETMMGRTVSSRTRQLYIRNHTLFIHVTSAVLKNELMMMRQSIIDKLNENAGEQLIDQIVIR